MPPLPDPALTALQNTLYTLLAPTPYACTSLTQLPGGTTSFVYLGVLTTPLILNSSFSAQITETQVIVKHATPFASCHTSFSVDAERIAYEAAMLKALSTFRSTADGEEGEVRVQVPEAYHYDEAGRVLVMQYIPSTAPLHTALDRLNVLDAEHVGRALGTWLSRFHAWCEEPEQTSLKTPLQTNKKEEELKWKLTWGQGTDVLDMLGNMLGEDDRAAWDAAKQRAYEEKGGRVQTQKSVVHGDFWTGKYVTWLNLLSKRAPQKTSSHMILTSPSILIPSPQTASNLTRHLHIIDFEFSHLAPPSTDISSFLGSLLEWHHILPSPPPSIKLLLSGFLSGYGPLDADVQRRVAIQTGVFVVNWWSRGPDGRVDVDSETRERGRALVGRGVGWVRDAWEGKAIEGLLDEVFLR